MTDLLAKLGVKQRKGSKPRCHWMTHGTDKQVAKRLTELVEPWASVAAADRWMPEGFAQTEEAQLHCAPRLLDLEIGEQLRDWWLAAPGGNSRTPNFDIASTCTVTVDGESKPGLLLVEAKAHTEELNNETAGKKLKGHATDNSRRNHEQIAAGFHQANLSLTEQTGLTWTLSHERCYQMSNRFAWSWKLAELGIPVILVYLGFLHAEEMRNGKNQKPFADHAEWDALVKSHCQPLFPETVWNNPWTLHGQSFIPLIRSMDIPYDQPLTEHVI